MFGECAVTIGSPLKVSVSNATMRKGEAQYITIDIDPYYTLQSITSSDPNVLEVKQDNAWNYIATAKSYGRAVIQATAVS